MISAFLISIGLVFITLGTIALVRFDDIYAKLHAISKVDNLGLGFIILGLLVDANSFAQILKILFIWGLILISSSSLSYIIAHTKYTHQDKKNAH